MTDTSKVALITGASTGIGNSLSRLLASNGYRVAAVARSAAKLQTLCHGINAEADGAEKAAAFTLDVQDQKAAEQVVDEVLAKFGRIDVLVNNAGLALGSPKPFQEHKIEEIDAVIKTNVLGPMYLTHAVLNKAMLKAGPDNCGEGDIVNVSSITGLDPPPMGEASYHTSKTGLEGFSNALRQELVGSNIRILVVRPGFVGGGAQFHAIRHARMGEDPENARQAMEDTFQGLEPLLPEDVASAILAQLSTPRRVALRAVDVVPTPQRSMYVLDRNWNERNLS